ncbi:MAG: hypothetical protein QOK40_261 [Miltoncostaeaceae bacterium]|nr:hypothetical protein [Miltoncostaeaceae bacterium]
MPLNPDTGVWSRLARFRPHALARLLEERLVVRIVVVRGTIHLVSADDCLLLRPLVQPVLDGQLGGRLEMGADVARHGAILRPPAAPDYGAASARSRARSAASRARLRSSRQADASTAPIVPPSCTSAADQHSTRR